MNKPLLSIVIPALNEERYLPKLLESLKAQSFKDYEILVVDALSKDRTVEIAKSHGCRIISCNKRAVGWSRNLGAEAASGKFILFADADVIFQKNALEASLREFQEKDLSGLGFFVSPAEKGIWNSILNIFINLYIGLFQFLTPVPPHGCAVLTTKEIHGKIRGFIEKPVLGEDHHYFRKLAEVKKFRILKSPKIMVSMRRFRSDGTFTYLSKYIITEFHNIRKKDISYDDLKYEFGKY